MNRTLEQRPDTYIDDETVSVPFDVGPADLIDNAARIRHHLENSTSLNVLTIAQRLLRPGMVATGSGSVNGFITPPIPPR